ncbi:MAG: OpgC domain-containing protein [Deltaproteobacteria bacterium]|nr:OpgC domain-containing protein [Deltaproteobacteria bacterium]
MPTPPASPVARVGAVDFARGALMLAIVAGHALTNLAPEHHGFALGINYFLSGTVGFVTVSGLLVGWFTIVKRDRYDRIAARYRLQAGRLLLIAHPLLALILFLPHAPVDTSFLRFATRTLFVTDTLAVLFFVLVPLAIRIPARARLAIGIAFFLINSIANLVHPVGRATALLHDLFDGVDPNHRHVLFSDYGFLPITGMFLIGSWIGDRLASAQLAGRERAFLLRLVGIAAGLFVLSAAMIGVWAAVHHGIHHDVARLLYPDYENTLYPAYLAGTLLLLAIASRLDLSHPVPRAITLIGKTSLFVYVAQYVLVQLLPYLFGWQGALEPFGWLALTLVASVALVPLAAQWNLRVKHAWTTRPRTGG